MLDVVAGRHHVEVVPQAQDAEHALSLPEVGHRGETRRVAEAPDLVQQGYVVRVALGLDEVAVGQEFFVDAQPDLNVGLPRGLCPELRHADCGRLL